MTIAALAAKYRVGYNRAYEIVRDVEGPRAPPGPRRLARLHADRDAKIAAAYFNGCANWRSNTPSPSSESIRSCSAKALGLGEQRRPVAGDGVVERQAERRALEQGFELAVDNERACSATTTATHLPESWVAHVTLAKDLPSRDAVRAALSVASENWTPFDGVLDRLEVIHFRPIHILCQIALTPNNPPASSQ
jgi:hypothetical protein